MADVTDFNLQGCPDRKDIQLELAKATYELCAAQDALNAARMGPITPVANRKALDESLAAAREKYGEISGRLAEHTDMCRACAALRKTA